MKNLFLSATLMALTFSSVSLHAAPQGDPAVGEELAKTRMCAGCHGLNGVSPMPIYPHLVGQHGAYLVKALTDFREKRRTDPTMNAMAGSLTDEDIAHLAAYFSSQSR